MTMVAPQMLALLILVALVMLFSHLAAERRFRSMIRPRKVEVLEITVKSEIEGTTTVYQVIGEENIKAAEMLCAEVERLKALVRTICTNNVNAAKVLSDEIERLNTLVRVLHAHLVQTNAPRSVGQSPTADRTKGGTN